MAKTRQQRPSSKDTRPSLFLALNWHLTTIIVAVMRFAFCQFYAVQEPPIPSCASLSWLRKTVKGPPKAALFACAPGRAHSLGGASPLLARQGEELAERQGCRGRLRIWRKPKAKRWPDEQEADTRRRSGVRWHVSSKPETYGTLRRISDRHKREGGCAIPGEICVRALCYRHREVSGCACRSQPKA